MKKLLNDGSGLIIEHSFPNGIKQDADGHYIFVSKSPSHTDEYIAYNCLYEHGYKHVSYKWNDLYEKVLFTNPKDKYGLFYPCACLIKKLS